MTTRADLILGNAPPHTLEDVMAGMARLRRAYDMDDEERQSRGHLANGELHPDLVRVQLIAAVAEWVRYGADEERRIREAAEDRLDDEAKQAIRGRSWPG